MIASAASEPDLATVRRYEAAGFRAWPATSVHYDGAWIIRLTKGHPAKRLNSVNPVDPSDRRDLARRVARAAKRFEAEQRPLTFRMSPLAPSALGAHFDAAGWQRFDESLVMAASLDLPAIDEAIDHIPLKDMMRFIEAATTTQGTDPAGASGLASVIGAIEPEAGLFVVESGDQPVATAICVHDGDIAGLFEVATRPEYRGQGFGRRLMLSALKWARLRGARTAWLQVEARNETARRLYGSIGFRDVYGYHYRRPA